MRTSKQVVCDSGIKGYQCKLQYNYVNFEEFKMYSEMYGLHERLGYKSAKSAWQKNPTIQGSSIPSDYKKVKL
jgi:deoxyadenosine/deoxycytidine kinase